MSYSRRYRGRRALSGVQSQPSGGRISRVAESLGDLVEYGLTGGQTPPPPPPPPSRVMAMRGRVGPHWYRQMQGVAGTSLGADDPTGHTLAVPTLSEPAGDVMQRIDQNVTSLVAAEAEEAKRRKITLALSIIGAVFAAAKLGIIAIPHIKKMRAGE